MPDPQNCQHGFYRSKGCKKCAEEVASSPLRNPSSTDECQCPKCGRLHKPLGFGTPPKSISAAPTLRAEIITEIMNLVRPKMIPLDHKLTVSELEKMLDEGVENISLNPDGSVLVPDTKPRTVGDVADAVLSVLQRHHG